MAANSQTVRRGITSLGKRFVNRQIWSGSSFSSSSTKQLTRTAATTTRGAHYSVYDKNVDEQVRPTVVPDELIQPESDKYWGPHPRTGVFGPASTDPNAGGGGDESSLSSAGNGIGGSAESVLEQKAWFRPLEDVEKPQQY